MNKTSTYITRIATGISVILMSLYFFISYIITDLYYESITDKYFFPFCLLVAIAVPLFISRLNKQKFVFIDYTADIVARCFLCYILFLYSIKKIEGNMFSLSLHDLDMPLGSASGFTLAWRFFGFNWKYDALIAASQIFIGLLLLFNRTKFIGALLAFLMFTFILSINVFIGIHIVVPVIVFVLLSVYLVRPVLYNLYKVLIVNKATVPVVQSSSVISYKSKKTTRLLVGAFIVITTAVSIYNENVFRRSFLYKSPLFGGWKLVSSTQRTNNKTQGIDKIYVEEANGSVIKDDNAKSMYGNMTLDTLKHILTVSDDANKELLNGMYAMKGDTLTIKNKEQQWQFVKFIIWDKGNYADIYSLFN